MNMREKEKKVEICYGFRDEKSVSNKWEMQVFKIRN